VQRHGRSGTGAAKRAQRSGPLCDVCKHCLLVARREGLTHLVPQPARHGELTSATRRADHQAVRKQVRRAHLAQQAQRGRRQPAPSVRVDGEVVCGHLRRIARHAHAMQQPRRQLPAAAGCERTQRGSVGRAIGREAIVLHQLQLPQGLLRRFLRANQATDGRVEVAPVHLGARRSHPVHSLQQSTRPPFPAQLREHRQAFCCRGCQLSCNRTSATPATVGRQRAEQAVLRHRHVATARRARCAPR